jgi:hypothetical protein
MSTSARTTWWCADIGRALDSRPIPCGLQKLVRLGDSRLNFDERTLLTYAERAGFSAIKLDLEIVVKSFEW